jgi:amphiphysin
MAAYILIQNSLLAQYYTTVHEYCQSQGFPSPSPPMDHIIADWKQNFDPARNEVESITLVARGKAVHKPMQLSTQESKSYTGLGIRSHTSSAASSAVAAVRGSSNKESSNGESKSYTGLGIRSHTSSAASSAVAAVRGGRDKIPSSSDSRLQRLPSSNSISPTSPDNRVMRIPSNNTLSSPTLSDTAQRISNGRPSHLSPAYTPRMEDVATASNALSKADYFTGLADRTRTQGTVQSPTSPSMSEAIAKKKPPPPPPKRTPSREPETWVAAIYDFSGQEQGDLSFRAGDRIKVLMQTGDKNDWWDGELNGRKGKFPANYCE